MGNDFKYGIKSGSLLDILVSHSGQENSLAREMAVKNWNFTMIMEFLRRNIKSSTPITLEMIKECEEVYISGACVGLDVKRKDNG